VDKFTKLLLSLIVALLAVIAYKLPMRETAVLAAPQRQISYSYQFAGITPGCSFSWDQVNKYLGEGYEIMNLAGAPAGGNCANQWAVLLRRPEVAVTPEAPVTPTSRK
jgi:hypothetical protein